MHRFLEKLGDLVMTGFINAANHEKTICIFLASIIILFGVCMIIDGWVSFPYAFNNLKP